VGLGWVRGGSAAVAARQLLTPLEVRRFCSSLAAFFCFAAALVSSSSAKARWAESMSSFAVSAHLFLSAFAYSFMPAMSVPRSPTFSVSSTVLRSLVNSRSCS